MNPRAVLLAFTALTLVALSGCESKKPDDMLRKSVLSQLGMAYHGFNMAEGRPPAGIQDLADYLAERINNSNAAAVLIDPLKRGRLVLIWNAVLTSDGEANGKFILGYEKNVSVTGGYIVTGGGFVQLITPEQFALLPKIANRPPETPSTKASP